MLIDEYKGSVDKNSPTLSGGSLGDSSLPRNAGVGLADFQPDASLKTNSAFGVRAMLAPYSGLWRRLFVVSR